MLTPGALTSTESFPKLEKNAWRSLLSLAATASTFGTSYDAGYIGCGVVVRAVVPRRGDEERVASVRELDRFQQALREVARRPRVVEHVGAVRGRVEDGADGVRGRPGPVAAEELQAHQADVPVHADDADAVVADRADRAGDVRPVPLVVCRVVVAVDEVPAAPVVDVAVAVVVDVIRATAAAVLSGVDPRVRGEIGMRLSRLRCRSRRPPRRDLRS